MPAVPLAQATSLSELQAFVAVEQAQPEGSLMQASLNFSGNSSDIDQLASTINQICLDGGVTPWPGSHLLALAEGSTIHIRWQKGMAWWGWILGALLTLVLPALLGAVLWVMLPESTRQMIESITYLGATVLLMLGLSHMMRPLIKEAV